MTPYDFLPPRHPGPVLLVGPLFKPPLLGGIESGVDLLLRSPLAATVSLQLFNTAREHDVRRPLWMKLRYQGVMCLQLALTIARLRPQVVHVKAASDVNFFQAGLYVAIARLLGRRVLMQIHGGDFREFFERGGTVQHTLIHSILRVPHGLLALSHSWSAYLHEIARVRSVTVVPNGLHTATYREATPDRARWGIPADRFAVLFINGRLPGDAERKGLPDLAMAVAEIRRRWPQVLLVLAGPAIDGDALPVTLGAKDDGWMDIGVVSADEKPSLYRSVDLFALPSKAENMPNTVLEAMAAGLPIITTPVGAIPEMVDDGKSGCLVPVGDVTALAECLDRLIADPQHRRQLGEQAARAVAERFDFSVVERRLLDVYSNGAADSAVGATAGQAHPLAPIVWYRRPGIQRRLRLGTRLLHMGPAEIAHRVERIAAKHARRVVDSQRSPDNVDPGLPAAMLADPEAYLTTRSTPRGYFDACERGHRIDVARSQLPRCVAATLCSAEAILEDGLDLLGRRFRPLHPDFDWLADPDHGRVWPLAALDDADAVRGTPVDVKFVWEVNRHQFFVTLARAFAYSGDARYADAIVCMVRHWIASNPSGLGVNWASNLEVAIRSLSWVWTLHFLLGARVLSAADLGMWLASLRQHRDYLVAHLSTYTDPTNHLIGEAAALAVVAMWLPEWPDSSRLQGLALDTLDRELQRQVADDGVDREQSTSYQRFVLDLVLQVVALADRNRVPLAPALRSRARAMLDAVDTLVGPASRAPRIGDGDDARGLPFLCPDVWDFSDLMATAAAVLDHPPPSNRRLPLCESALWLAGDVPAPGDGDPTTGASAWRSTLLANGGYAVLCSARQPERDRLLFDCGPLGYLPHASHGHADLLSVLVDLDGEEVLVDAGTFAYRDPDGHRDLLRSTRAHNTVEIGGRNQADSFDPFKWLNLPPCGIETSRLSPHVEYVEAWHDGYRRLRPAVRHRRGVLGLRTGWLVIDWIEGATGAHDVVRSLHAAPSTTLQQIAASKVRIWTPSGRAALVVTDIGANAGDGAAITPALFPYSEQYGRMMRAPVLTVTERIPLPGIRLTLLAIHTRSEDDLLRITALAGTRESGAVWLRLAEPGGAEVEVAARTERAPNDVGPLRTDARLVVIRRGGADNMPPTVFTTGGTRLEDSHAR